MIAPAMNTRPQEVLLYRDLARQQARISRRLDLTALPRIMALVDALDGADVSAAGVDNEPTFEVVLQFAVDASGFSRVEGELSGQVPLNCNGCAEVLLHQMRLTFGCVIAETEAIADGLVDDGRMGESSPLIADVLVANGTEVTVAQIVEDEILLNLPERLCTSEPCERAPELAYPAQGELDGNADADTQAEKPLEGEENPFSVLAQLKQGGDTRE